MNVASQPFFSCGLLVKEWQMVRELAMLHAWLDSWSGLGAIVVGMRQHGYEVSLRRARRGGSVVGNGATTPENSGAHGHARSLTPRTVADADGDFGARPQPDDALLHGLVRDVQLASEAGMAEVGGGMTREDSDDLVGSIGQDALVAVDVREVIVVVEDHAPRHDPRAAGWADRVRRDGHQVQATVDQPLRQHPPSACGPAVTTALQPTADRRPVFTRPERQEPALAIFNGVVRCREPSIRSLDDGACVPDLPAPAGFGFSDGDDFHLRSSG